MFMVKDNNLNSIKAFDILNSIYLINSLLPFNVRMKHNGWLRRKILKKI